MPSKGSKRSFVPLKSFKPITSQRHARKATSEFHNGEGTQTMYQAASALLTGLHKTSSKFVFRTITKLGLRPSSGEPRLKTLEIGAVNTQLLESPFLEVFAIDLKSRHPKIKEMDFFKLEPNHEYDLVVSAMVLNCVKNPEDRGRMLLMCREHLKDGGIFILVLPARCFPGEEQDRFEEDVMARMGFEVVEREGTPKVVHICFRLVHRPGTFDPSVEFHPYGQLLDVVLKPAMPSSTADTSKRSRRKSGKDPAGTMGETH